MKKLLTVTLLVVMVAMSFATVVNAATSASLADEIYAIGSKYGMTAADKVRLQRDLKTAGVKDTDADAILAKVKDAANVMDAAGVTDYNKLTGEQKSQIKSLANQAASIAGVELKFDGKNVGIYKDGELIDTVSNNDGKLAYTGNNVNTVLVVSSVAIIALAAAVVAKKRLANAR